MHDFDIYFSGQLLPNADATLARKGVGKLFKLQGHALDKLFAGNPVRIARSVDVEKANRYRAAFRKFGALIDVVPHHAEPPKKPATQADNSTPAEPHSALTLLPPQTGSLEDCAPVVEARRIGDISHMDLAAPGTELAPPQPQPDVEYDISGFSLNPANSGTLEDCASQAEPPPAPNTDHLSLINEKE